VAERNRIGKLKEALRGMIVCMGYECVGVDASASASADLLRIYIDSTAGVGHSDCVAVSRTVTEYLDKCDEEGNAWFKGKYLVEVSSPGLERPLFTPEHYARFVGKLASVRLVNGRKLKGVIASCDEEGNVSLETAGTGGAMGELVRMRFDEIRRGNLLYIEEKGTGKRGRSSGIR
jgi:ribosome maturation factor RimP